MAKAAKKEVGITLPPLNIQMMDVTVVGDTPLITHAWSLKAKREMLASHMMEPTEGKQAKDPQDDFEQSLYRLDDGTCGFPSVAFKTAAVTAGTSVAGLTKIAARQAFQVIGEPLEVEGALEGVKVRQNLVRIDGTEPRLREDMVRVGMGKPDIRYRGEFWPWHVKLLVKFNANVLSAAQILNLLNVAGFAVGVGEWRPEKDGEFGMFHVATEADIRRLEMRRAA